LCFFPSAVAFLAACCLVEIVLDSDLPEVVVGAAAEAGRF